MEDNGERSVWPRVKAIKFFHSSWINFFHRGDNERILPLEEKKLMVTSICFSLTFHPSLLGSIPFSYVNHRRMINTPRGSFIKHLVDKLSLNMYIEKLLLNCWKIYLWFFSVHGFASGRGECHGEHKQHSCDSFSSNSCTYHGESNPTTTSQFASRTKDLTANSITPHPSCSYSNTKNFESESEF